MTAFAHRFWSSVDGSKLHYRDYPGDDTRPPILCIPGLTRNARDFEGVAARLAGAWRVIAVDLRGRGESAPARDPASYTPVTYLADIQALLVELSLPKVVVFGTSLGGIVGLLLAHAEPNRIAGALLNDVGPEIEPAGMGRIRSLVGRAQSWPTWMHAARALADAHGDIHPGFGIEDWLRMAKRLYRLTSAGRIVPDYDMRIAEPLRAPDDGAPIPDLWPMLEDLAGVPVLVVRGERSDILSAHTAERMLDLLPRGELVTLAGVGHAPTLDEPAAIAAIDRLLARVGG